MAQIRSMMSICEGRSTCGVANPTMCIIEVIGKGAHVTVNRLLKVHEMGMFW